MLSSRDTPFSGDGWALVIEDIRRLALLIGGGANDLNAGATDGDQQALNTLSSALNAHEIDPNAHPQYLKISDYVAGTPSAVDFYVADTANGAINAGQTPLTLGWSTTATTPAGTLTGFTPATGLFIPPANGVYAFVFGFTGTPTSFASWITMSIFGTLAPAYWTLPTNLGNGGYSAAATIYCATTQSVSFAWTSGTNWTGATFRVTITRIS